MLIVRLFLSLLLCQLVFSPAQATSSAPYLPSNDDEVVQTLPKSIFDLDPRLEYLRLRLGKTPKNLKLAVAVAKRYVSLGLKESDPRYFGYAQAALSSWWSQSSPPIEVLMVRATILQNRLQLNPALALLDTVLTRQPDHKAAILNRALILREQGFYKQAMQACTSLQSNADSVSSAVCSSSIDAVTGKLNSAYEKLQKLLPVTIFGGPGMRQWVLIELGTVAEQTGDFAQAEKYYKDAVKIPLSDPMLPSLYYDVLLERQKYTQVIEKFNDSVQNDKLRLRLAIAAKALDMNALVEEHSTLLKTRFESARLRGDKVHLRDETQFLLQLQNQPRQALVVAKLNWLLHKEPIDMLLYLQASLRASNYHAAKPVLDWINTYKVEDKRLQDLVSQLDQP